MRPWSSWPKPQRTAGTTILTAESICGAPHFWLPPRVKATPTLGINAKGAENFRKIPTLVLLKQNATAGTATTR
jgi:hypothetical protein